jgi:hypothetical protein
MNPAFLAIAPMLFSMIENMSGKNDAKQGSTFRPGAISEFDKMLEAINGMRGAQDVTQNPNYQQGQEWLQSMFSDPEFFKNFEAPLQRQFQEQTIPDLANRFASMGSGGSLGSTGFRNQLGREGSNLHSNIAALRGGIQQQGVNQSLNYAQQPFNNLLQMQQLATQPTQNTYQPPSGGFWGPIAGAVTGGAAQGYGNQWGQNMAQQRFAGQSPGTY